MKCISLWQPYATLLVHGLKRCETRSWPTNHTGPLLIHAAKKWDVELAEFAVLPPARAALEAIGVRFIPTEAAARAGWNLAFGSIVGVVQLDRCYPTGRVTFALCNAGWLRFSHFRCTVSERLADALRGNPGAHEVLFYLALGQTFPAVEFTLRGCQSEAHRCYTAEGLLA